MENKEIIRKSIVERAADIWYRILDPDWFDRSCDEVMWKPVTKEDFDKWFWKCTVQKIAPKQVEISVEKLEQFIQELKPIFIKRGLDHEHFDRAFRKSEVFWLIMEQINFKPQPKNISHIKPIEHNTVKHMLLMREHWMTLKEIGEIYWITWERVRQLTST